MISVHSQLLMPLNCQNYLFIDRPPLHKGGGVNFFKIDGNGGGLKIFARKRGLGKMGGLPYSIEVFLEISHVAA